VPAITRYAYAEVGRLRYTPKTTLRRRVFGLNAERLHVVAKAVKEELESSSIATHLQELTTHLQNQINQPNQPQQNVSNKLTQIYPILRNAASNKFSPAWQQIINDIGGSGLLGIPLADKIQVIFERNQITLPQALQELTPISQAVANFKAGIDQLVLGLDQLKIGTEDPLQPGECEVGVAIPRQALEDDLSAFTDELSEVAFILATFVELSTGVHQPLSIRTVSSTNFLLYIGVGIWAARTIAYGAEHIIESYKKILEIRKLKADAHRLGLPEQTVTGIEEYATSEMAKTIEQTTSEIVAKFSRVTDSGRKNELTTKLRFSLNKMANRIDNGWNFEVRLGPLPPDQQDDAQTKEAIAIIQSASSSLQYIRMEGERILLLPEGESAGQEQKKKGSI
jgi:hypothetical protein